MEMVKHRSGKNAPNWQGGKAYIDDKAGRRVLLYFLGHPNAYKGHYVLRYVLIAEKVLGTLLPKGAVIHHVDNNTSNDNNNNLVICENDTYHILLHLRQRAYNACGHATWRKCKYCKKYDSPENLEIYYSGVCHAKCRKQYCKEWHRKKHDSSST